MAWIRTLVLKGVLQIFFFVSVWLRKPWSSTVNHSSWQCKKL